MAIDAKFYMHDSDKIALQALEAIPGFSQLFKAFMKIWSEKQFRIQNMSSNLRISEKQLPKYYNMLPPICEKLGIDVPELYLKLDVEPNAYTAGDTNPFIVITSGLLETIPEELIPTVLAHECGHIACHHCLYTTMGQFVLSEAINLLGLDGVAVLPIQVAFFYWMRCSEFSADRAAALYDGSADNVVKMCMHFAGYDKDIAGEANVEEFMNQALEYKAMVDDSKWDKTLEFMFMYNKTHPLAALRAFECNEFGKTDRFIRIAEYIRTENNGSDENAIAFLREVPIAEPSKYYIGKNIDDVIDQLTALGFNDVRRVKTTQKGNMAKSGQVICILINGHDGFNRYEWYPVDSVVEVEFYEPETEEEVAAAHPGQRRVPDSSKRYLGRSFEGVVEELNAAGFANIELECQRKAKKGWLSKEGAISKISVSGQTQFEKGEWFAEEAVIRIAYYSYGAAEEALPESI